MTEDWKKMMDNRIEKMGDAHIMEVLRTWERIGESQIRRDPKVSYALDKVMAEAKKRRLRS